MRAAFGASRWTQIVLPHPGSGVTPLEDALLSTDLDCDNTVNHYWVSRDDGDSWSVRRAFPEGTCLVRPAGNVVFTAGAEETRWWRSKDLVHWDRASTTRYDDEVSRRAYSACPSSLGREPGHRGGDEHPVRIGAEVFKLFHLSNTDSRKLELRVSHDDCRTWKRVLP
jgi:hypothetical protein